MALAVAGAVAAAWAVLFGPLRGHLSRMDPRWASVLAGKDYIFPGDWGPLFWIVNLGYVALILSIYQIRRTRGVALPREQGLAAGAIALLCVFLLSWLLMRGWIALALQLQTSRVFWMLDALASIYLAWLLAEGLSPRMGRALVALVLTFATARGIYVALAEHAGHPIVSIGLPSDDWTDVMKWVSRTPKDSHILADPGHAWKYGTSVRVAGERDVYMEEVKDVALALYSRRVAMQVLGRIQDAHDFDALTPARAQSLAAQYGLDYLVVDRDIALPMVYRNARFRVYALGH
jgi:hypothetical protein